VASSCELILMQKNWQHWRISKFYWTKWHSVVRDPHNSLIIRTTWLQIILTQLKLNWNVQTSRYGLEGKVSFFIKYEKFEIWRKNYLKYAEIGNLTKKPSAWGILRRSVMSLNKRKSVPRKERMLMKCWLNGKGWTNCGRHVIVAN